MDNVFDWIYLPQNNKNPASFKSPKARIYTINEVEQKLTNLKVGDTEQIELLEVLAMFKDLSKEESKEELKEPFNFTTSFSYTATGL